MECAAGGSKTGDGEVLDKAIINSHTLVPCKFTALFKIISYLLVASVAFLIFLGGNVKSHEAGLAVPDWPTSFGYNMFTFPVEYWVGGIFHEHFHRLVASAVGFVTIALVVVSYLYEKRRTVRLLSYLALAVVCIQGILGGLTVLFGLPAWTSVLHGMLAQIFFCLTITIAFYYSNFTLSGVNRIAQGENFRLMRLARIYLVFSILLLLQLFLGAFTRHLEAGLAAPDFPTVAGAWLPSWGESSLAVANAERQGMGLPAVTSLQLGVHICHRLFGYLLALIAIFLVVPKASNLNGYPFVRSGYRAFILLVILQIVLGVSVILTGRVPLMATFHVVTGALLLGCCWLNFIRTTWVLRLSRD